MSTTLTVPQPLQIHYGFHSSNDTSSSVTVLGLQLGQVANLLLGFTPADASTAPFWSPQTAPLPTSDVKVSTTGLEIWGFPHITLHQDTASLLSAVYPYSVQPLTGDTGAFSVPSGPLMIGDVDSAQVLAQVGKHLGVDLAAGYSYMLVEMVRSVGTASGNYVAGSGGDATDHLTPDALAAMCALPGVTTPNDQLTADKAGAFLKSFETIGTHYVSKVTAGDRIYQVFAYEAAAFEQLTSAFRYSAGNADDVEGVNAIAFQYYTTPRNSDTGRELGYVAQMGSVNMVSRDPAFAATVQSGLWNDSIRAGGNSIFSACLPGTQVDLSKFRGVVPIRFELTPLGNLIPVHNLAHGRESWNRLLKGALLQKYGQQVRVTFPSVRPYQWQSLLPNTGTWLSTIATPTVNVYDGHVALGAIRLTNRAAVKSFSSWSVVLEAGEASLPGDQVALSSYLIDASGGAAPPTIELASQAAFQGISLACGHMDGALMITYADGLERKTVMDGIVLESTGPGSDTGRSGLKVSGDLFGGQDAARLEVQMSNLNFAIVTCQTLLYTRGDMAADAQGLARDCLVWLTDIIPNDETVPQDLATIRLRAAYMAHVARRLDEEGVTVPYLTYSAYSAYIQAMSDAANALNATISDYQAQIRHQQQLELTATTAAQINANIKSSGQLLIDYIHAVAANQSDIAANYQHIITTKQTELQKAIDDFATLAQSVSDQKDAVEDAKLTFERAMVSYETSEIIKAVLNISTAFMTAGFTIVTPASTLLALQSLGETAQKIQKLVTVLSKIMDLEKTIESSVRNIVAVNQTLDQLQSSNLGMPTAMEWSEMSINFDASLVSVPAEVAGPKAQFSAAFKILVLRAQAMLTAQAKIAQLNADIALNQAQQKINQDQQARLDKLTTGLNLGDTSAAPNLSEVDLLSLTGHVQSQLNQVLGSLAQAIILQDSAVQFELLAPPLSIQKFDLNNLQIAMANQQGNIILAKSAFNPPPFIVNDPIQVTIKGVPISAFTGGNTFEFQIQPSESEFQPYNMVRVQQVVVDIPAIQGSTSGRYRIDLSFDGNPFEDRSPSDAPLTFNTVTRYFGPFEYKVSGATHTPVFGDQTGSIGNDITRITPFSTWRVQMPALDVNKGLDFGTVTAVDIVLSFRIEALARRALLLDLAARSLSPTALTHGDMKRAMRARSMALAMAAPVATGGATVADMLSQMFKAQGVLKGWDCVLNMLEEPVNKFLSEQYKNKYNDAKPMTVTCGFCVPFPAGSNTVLTYTKFSVQLGPPLLEFQANNHNFVAVTQNIQSGYIQKGSKIVAQENATCPVPLNLDDPSIGWGSQAQIDVTSAPHVTGTVALGMVQGLVQPPLPDGTRGQAADSHSVVLDFSQGSFVAKNLNIDTDQAELNLQLSNWFVNNPIEYLINTVVFNNATTLPSLQPTKFKLNVLTTNSNKNVLQVFIATTGQQQNNLTINVNEPIPDGYHNSLMINTKILFQDIFVTSFNQGSSNLQVESVDPGDNFTAWSARISQGTVTGEATFDNSGNSQTRINANGNSITWPLAGLTFAPTQDQGVSLNYSAQQRVNFQHRTYNCSSGQYGTSCSWSRWSDYSVDVNVALTGNYPLTVTNADGKQEVQIASAPPTVTLTPPDLKPTGPCECNDNDLKIMVGDILKKEVPKKLQDSMAGIKFSAVSVFALYNLLFPTDDFIVMQLAYVPGDLVVLGTFNKYAS